MEIDKRTIKALSADARVKILKMLQSNRKIAADISKELGLAPSTISEHLKMMENAGLVKKIDTGRKWIYYEISEKGRTLIRPKLPAGIIMALSLGIALVFTGVLNFFSERSFLSGSLQPAMRESAKITSDAAARAAAETRQIAAASPAINWLFMIVIAAGIILVIAGLIKFRKIK